MPDDSARRALVQRLQSLRVAGVSVLPKGGFDDTAVPATAVETQPVADASAESIAPLEASTPLVPQTPLATPTSSLGDESGAISSAPTLEVLNQEVAQCTLCGELATTRTQTVFGVGNPDARLVFLGEAPGADEDRTGAPFVGRAGQLLDKIIQACTLRREDVYIMNILKCRPPGNRNPTPCESDNCRRFLLRQLDLIRPEFICCLGAVAAQNLLDTTQSIGRLRGRVHDYRGIKVVCTYHPAYLLRTPSAKKDTWEDMKSLMRQLGVEL